jgi:hypothetical protein
VTTFFVWWIFINKNNMNFQVNLGDGVNQEQRVINSSSWSTCLAYCEGTELPILTIQTLPQTNIVVHDSGTNNCYTTNIVLGGVRNSYMVWANDFQSFTTWINSLTSPVIQSVQNSNKLYVTV